MAELSSNERDKLKDSQFAYVDTDGTGHLPIHDESHVRNAVARFSQTNFESEGARREAARSIVAAARKQDVDLSEDDEVCKAAS